MYNNTQYPNSGYHSAYPQYQQNYAANYTYPSYTHEQPQSTYATQTTQPTPPGEGNFTTSNWSTTSYASNKDDAVAKEMQQQKAQLTKQREEYVRKVLVLRRELEQLRHQKQQLTGDNRSADSRDRDLVNILKENDKLQDEIQGKMKAIQNVIEMLSSIIKDGKSVMDLELELAQQNREVSRSPAAKSHSSYTRSKKSMTPEVSHHTSAHHHHQGPKSPERFCYVHYDTGLHWCRSCDEFPETAKDFLLHLQEKSHREMVKENDVDITPWHKLPSEEVLPSNDDAPRKRIPIKGLQFFISAPAWYCKLCDIWIGDLHCASHHLKSVTHFQNYENFVAQNPHWEMEWLKDREKAMSRKGVQSSDSDDSKKRKKKRHSHDTHDKKDRRKKRSKKKRKHSSDSSSTSSSSDSSSDDDTTDKSKSIRVAMRNMKQVQSIMNEDLSAKWSVLEKLVEEHKRKEDREREKKEKEDERDDPLINQWMTVEEPPEKEKLLLESLKDRMKQKQIAEKAKMAEQEYKRLEREKLERELKEKKERAKREAAAAAEIESRRREEEEAEKVRSRDAVRFKANYRRRRSLSRSSDEDEKRKRDSYSSRLRKDSEGSNRSFNNHHNSRSRSRTPDSKANRDEKEDKDKKDKKPPGPPSYKKLPFIGRMPLFKNKKTGSEKEDEKKDKEIQMETYEPPRKTRFQPGNLAKAFIPRPDVVCFPKLSCIPPLNLPPPPPTVSEKPPEPLVAPDPPKISGNSDQDKGPNTPPPPKIAGRKGTSPPPSANLSDDEVLYAESGEGMNPTMVGQYYQQQEYSMYQQHDMYHPPSFAGDSQPEAPPPPANAFTMPLEPPPLPPDDDLALLGICADDMAAQSF